MKSICDLTLEEIMGEDLDVHLSSNKVFGINIEIDDEHQETVVKEEGVHIYAIDCLADFCKRYLNTYEKVKKELI